MNHSHPVVMKILFFSLLCFSFNLSLADEYLNDVSKRTVSVICKDKEFLNYSNLNNAECKVLLPTLTKECNEHVKILIPEPSDDENVDAINVKKARKLGILYSMCIRVLIYERKNTNYSR